MAYIRFVCIHDNRDSSRLAIIVQLERPFRDIKREIDGVCCELIAGTLSVRELRLWRLCPTHHDLLDIAIHIHLEIP